MELEKTLKYYKGKRVLITGLRPWLSWETPSSNILPETLAVTVVMFPNRANRPVGTAKEFIFDLFPITALIYRFPCDH